MRYVFLTAMRNEERILDEFFAEFDEVVRAEGIADETVLYLVDDLSTDASRAKAEAYAPNGWQLRVIPAPSNLGNQGAMFFGLQHLEIDDEDVLITFDCDGEDDVGQVPSILALAREHPGKLVLIERGRRSESLLFKLMFAVYKASFRILTRKRVIPNNFMLIPGRWVPAVRSFPLASGHLAYGILRLGFPYTSVVRDRRARYGGKTSQNLFSLVTHGLVGLMVFFEVVVAKLFMFLIGFVAALAVLIGLGIAGEARTRIPDEVLHWTSVGLGGCALVSLGMLLASGLVLFLKVLNYSLVVEGRMPALGSLRAPPTLSEPEVVDASDAA